MFASGIALWIWARVHVGRKRGDADDPRAEPELVTSGPYRFVRHPIYSGLLARLLGTALVTNLIGLIVVAILGGFFYVSGSVAEKNLTATFPTVYPKVPDQHEDADSLRSLTSCASCCGS